ncbi:hypothetical protein HpCHN102_10060 [Helicobacter pylori]|nr:hypothetical protein VN0420_13480 [Helicobacter pylori]
MISNISITPIKNMLKSALNIHNFSFKSHTRQLLLVQMDQENQRYQYYSRH